MHVGRRCMSHDTARGVGRHLVHHDLLGGRRRRLGLLMVRLSLLVSGEAQQVLLVRQRRRRGGDTTVQKGRGRRLLRGKAAEERGVRLLDVRRRRRWS